MGTYSDIVACPLFDPSALKMLKGVAIGSVGIPFFCTRSFAIAVCVHPESINALTLCVHLSAVHIVVLIVSSCTEFHLWGIVYLSKTLDTWAREFALTLSLRQNAVGFLRHPLLLLLSYS
jgi:hypothetical protein